MPLVHLFCEGVGPFKEVHLDLSVPGGGPCLGPHIFAGVNGCGKSTLLKALAWTMAGRDDGFPVEEWRHFLAGRPTSRVLALINIVDHYSYAWAITKDLDDGWPNRLSDWVAEKLRSAGFRPEAYPLRKVIDKKQLREGRAEYEFSKARFGGPEELPSGRRFALAAYSSARSIRFIQTPDVSLPRRTGDRNRFSFESTVQNAAIQAWLLSTYSKWAIAKEREQPTTQYTESLQAFDRALKQICGEDMSVHIDIEPNLLPSIRSHGRVLNFSQIPDGVKATIGLLGDFMTRSASLDWDSSLEGLRPGILLLDEIDACLHPLWQRRLLPGMKMALPQTQILVASHSPFVISSCPGSVVHVLRIDDDGYAHADPPLNAPIGEGIATTLKEIFGVASRFDVQTEAELAEWNELKKLRMHGRLTSKQSARYAELQKLLSTRSEELRVLVNGVPKLPKSAVDSLVGSVRSTRRGVRETAREP